MLACVWLFKRQMFQVAVNMHTCTHIDSLRFSTYQDDDARRAIDIYMCVLVYIYLFIYTRISMLCLIAPWPRAGT